MTSNFHTPIPQGSPATSAVINSPLGQLDDAIGQGFAGNLFGGRLTLQSGNPVPTTDQTAATNLYVSPFLSNVIALYDGSKVKLYVFSETGYSLSGFTINSNYDIFGFPNSGVLGVTSAIWASDTARATAITLQNGFYAKSGDPTQRYLGTIRITGSAGQCEDSLTRRLVYNHYNRVRRLMRFAESTSHSYTTGSWRDWNNSAANQIDFVHGWGGEGFTLSVQGSASAGTGVIYGIGAGVNQTGAPGAQEPFVYDANQVAGAYKGNTKESLVGLGYNYIRFKEFGGAGITLATINAQAGILL